MPFDFKQIIAASPNPYVLMDTDLKLVWANDAYLQVTMSERDAIIGRQLFDAFPSEGESFRQLQGSLQKVLDTERPDEIALIRYDIKAADGRSEVRYWSATHTPIFEDGTLTHILQHTVDVTELEKLRQVRDEIGILRRAQTIQDENRVLRDETRKLLGFFNQAPGFTAVILGPEHRFAVTNKAYDALVGRSDLVGRTVAEALPEVVSQGFVEVLDNVYRTGEAYFGRREQVMLRTESSDEEQRYFLNFVFQPLFDETGTVRGITVQGHDVTEEVLAIDRQTLLANELNHRVKNTLAIVQGLALQSFKGPQVERERTVFTSRLRTLAQAHDLLTEGAWSEAEVADIVRKSAQAAAGDAAERLTLDGPTALLSPQTAVSFAMIVHELCTNAMKYGALSNDDGTVSVSWTVAEDDIFRFEWKERGGPPVTPPENRGFGTRLIARGIGTGSSDEAELDFSTGGVTYTMEARLDRCET